LQSGVKIVDHTGFKGKSKGVKIDEVQVVCTVVESSDKIVHFVYLVIVVTEIPNSGHLEKA